MPGTPEHDVGSIIPAEVINYTDQTFSFVTKNTTGQ